MMLMDKSIFWKAVKPGALTYGNSFYTRRTGIEKMCYRAVEIKGDLIDTFEYAFSEDNGKTWSKMRERKVWEPFADGSAMRRHIMPGFVDPVNGRLLVLYNEAHMPHDDAADGFTNTFLKYTVSTDGGRTDALDDMIIQQAHTAENPIEGVTIGRNAVMLGDNGSGAIRTHGGNLLAPAQISPVGTDGNYINLGGGPSYHEVAVLIGRWSDDPSDISIIWNLSEYVRNDPSRSTRGAFEPTIAQFPDGRVLMALRGSNGGVKDPEFRLPGHRWYTVSSDEGYSWAPVRIWTYSDGEPFFSPSSMSQLLMHSNGECYWIGNICRANPKGNSPRYPIVIGRVNPESLLLERGSIYVIDDRQQGEDEAMTLSNFHAHEDRMTGDILLHMSRWLTRGLSDWTADALLYRVAL